jgi:PAS domain S-box-containing protein
MAENVNEERYRPRAFGMGRLFDDIRDAIIVAELRAGEIVLWNDSATRILGYTREEAVGRPLVSLVPEELREAHLAAVSRFADTGRGKHVDSHMPLELQALTKDGRRVDVEVQFIRIPEAPDDGKYVGAFVRDISARKKLERDRVRLTKEFQLLLQSTGEGFFGLDTDGLCTFSNAAGAEMFGYREYEVLGKDMHELIHHSFADGAPYPKEECPIFDTLRSGRGHRMYDEVMWRGDGTPIPVRYSSYPIIDEGRLRGAVVAIEDITARKRLEEALRDRNEQLRLAFEKERDSVKRLQDLDVLKNEFVAMVAHDLRSPMTVVAGMADAIRNRWESMEEVKKLTFLEMISDNIHRLSDLVEDILVVARLESEEFSYELAPFDLVALVRRVGTEMGGQAGRDVLVRDGDELPDAYADDQRTWQVLTNLVSNALKFSPRDSEVEIEIVHDDNDMLRVAVIDQGIGMLSEEQSKLFQKFARLSQTGLEKQISGTGLGLYISKRMVEDQGGHIWVESEVGEGSTFTFTIPVATEEAS